MQRRLAIAAVLALAAAALAAQDRPAPPEPSFEVVSVKANVNDAVPEGISLQATGVRFTAFRVRTLIGNR